MKSFNEIDLPEEVQQALRDINFVDATEIQGEAIPVLLEGKDLMACAETGSGKTAAYGIPLVVKVLEDKKRSGLILAPTRELAQQIAQFLRQVTAHCENFQITLLVGGLDIRKQFKALQKKPKIIVATPGRLNDHLKRNTVQLNNTEVLVLDEGDRMLDMGFAWQLDEIVKHLPTKRQTSLFTATLPDKVIKLAKQYLHKPEKITVGRVSLPVESIKQSVIQVEFKQKDDRILDELNNRSGSIIVFCRTKHRTDRLARHLADYGYDVDLIHGGRTQGQRNKAIRNFKSGKSRILCATDVAARGIDVPQVEHVINFDLPTMDEDYVHRIGRTARNGALGEAVSFVTSEEHRDWTTLVRKYKIPGVELTGVRRDSGAKKKFKGGGGGRRSDGKRAGSTGRGKPSWKSKWDGAGSSDESPRRGPKSKRFSRDDSFGDEKRGKSKKVERFGARSFDDDRRKSPSRDDRSRNDWSGSEKPRNDWSRDDSFSGDKRKSGGKKSRFGAKSYEGGERKKSSKFKSQDKWSRDDSSSGDSKKSFGKKKNSSGKKISFKKKKQGGKSFAKPGGFKKSQGKKSSSNRSSRFD